MAKQYFLEEAEIKNFKGISFKKLIIGGKSFIISGKNGKGKSSLIQAINTAFSNDQKPVKPVKEGEESAEVKLKLKGQNNDGDPREYTIRMTFKPDGNGTITVYNQDMEKLDSTKSFVKNLFEHISFDILSFLKEKPSEQVKILKTLAGEEFCQQLDDIETERKKKFDDRTFKNRVITEKDAKLRSHGYSQEEIDKYIEELDPSELEASLAELSKKQQDHDKVLAGINDRVAKITSNIERKKELEDQIERIKDQIAAIQQDNTKINQEISKAREWVDRNPRPDIQQIKEQIEAANTHNLHYQRIQSYIAEINELNNLKGEVQNITSEITKLEEKKVALFSKSTLPVEGLSFDEEKALINGLPLDENQIERSMLIKTGVQIAMAMNPTLRLVTIQDASLLDKESIKQVIEMCKKGNYQLIMEIVGDEEEPVIEFIEKDI